VFVVVGKGGKVGVSLSAREKQDTGGGKFRKKVAFPAKETHIFEELDKDKN